MPPTAVVVDDHGDFRALASELLGDVGYQVVGSYADGRTAIAALAGLMPDLVLLDVQLPDLDGFAVCGELDARLTARVVLVSTREEADYGQRVRRSRAAGFIGKADLSRSSLAALVGPL
ncbi:MAG: response regulator transcription factor [Nocardioides sp.]